MLYYYAHSGHRVGMDRVKRGTALLNKLRNDGVECQLLVNDFRAGLAGKDWGGKEYVTIDTIQDIDAVAMARDSVIIDSDEDDHGRLVKFCAEFANVWRFEHDASDVSIHGERMIREVCGEDCLDAKIVDDKYFEQSAKTQRILFFLGDSDRDKVILKNEAFFKAFEMELLLGNYFFVKYEKDLSQIFSTLHEPEEYMDVIMSSSCVVTASAQTALEAQVSGAKVVFLNIASKALYSPEVLASYGIHIVEGFDVEGLKSALNFESKEEAKRELTPYTTTEIRSKL